MHQKSAAAIAPMLSMEWVGFPSGYQCSTSRYSPCVCQGPECWFPLLLEISIMTSAMATDSFLKQRKAATSRTQGFL